MNQPWTTEYMAMFWRHTNAEIEQLTGWHPQVIRARRLEHNQMRNNWPKFDPERKA